MLEIRFHVNCWRNARFGTTAPAARSSSAAFSAGVPRSRPRMTPRRSARGGSGWHLRRGASSGLAGRLLPKVSAAFPSCPRSSRPACSCGSSCRRRRACRFFLSAERASSLAIGSSITSSSFAFRRLISSRRRAARSKSRSAAASRMSFSRASRWVWRLLPMRWPALAKPLPPQAPVAADVGADVVALVDRIEDVGDLRLDRFRRDAVGGVVFELLLAAAARSRPWRGSSSR